jgi:hypothetical protein
MPSGNCNRNRKTQDFLSLSQNVWRQKQSLRQFAFSVCLGFMHYTHQAAPVYCEIDFNILHRVSVIFL